MEAATESKSHYQLETDPGPEDIALDTSTGTPRLIISCDHRRNKKGNGSIMQAGMDSRKATPMQFAGEGHPKEFHPQGISLTRDDQGATLLYVVSRQKRGHAILVYEVSGDTLIYVGNLLDATSNRGARIVRNPNDIAALPDRRAFVTGNPGRLGLLTNRMTGNPSSSLWEYSPERGWGRVNGSLRFANGVVVQSERVLVSTTFGKHVWAYSLENPNAGRQKLATAPTGLDNFQKVNGDSDHYVTLTGLQSFVKFVLHGLQKKVPSPSDIFRLSTRSGELWQAELPPECLPLSAASTVLEYDQKLYVGQVFNSNLTVIHKFEWHRLPHQH